MFSFISIYIHGVKYSLLSASIDPRTATYVCACVCLCGYIVCGDKEKALQVVTTITKTPRPSFTKLINHSLARHFPASTEALGHMCVLLCVGVYLFISQIHCAEKLSQVVNTAV